MPDNFNDVMRKILEIFPNATVGEDDEGQLVIYTDKHVTKSDELIDFIAE